MSLKPGFLKDRCLTEKPGFIFNSIVSELRYTIFDTDAGWVGVLASEEGLRRLTLPRSSADEARLLLGNDAGDAASTPRFFLDLIGRLEGYFAGKEPLRLENGKRLHEQQSPIELLTRIILSSSKPNDMVFDPFAGSGTTLVVAKQLNRNSIGIEIDLLYAKYINQRIKNIKPSDDISKLKQKYKHTKDLDKIWG